MKQLSRKFVRRSVARGVLGLYLAVACQAAFAETRFPSREAAVDALIDAVDRQDTDRLESILGSEYAAFQRGQASDPALVGLRARLFVNAIREFHSFASVSEDRYILIMGAMAWPFPIPLVHSGDAWYFDGSAGVEELRNRIVGSNELRAIALLKVYAAAQRRYSLRDHDDDGVLEFASGVVSTPGTQDGLYWESGPGDDKPAEGPLGPIKELADAILGERDQGAPLLGYHFRMLFAQGASAKAGAFDYRINGHQLGGFAMVAWPADYGETGVMSFIINQDQVIYESDLGADSASIAESLTLFDPGPGWTAVSSESPAIN